MHVAFASRAQKSTAHRQAEEMDAARTVTAEEEAAVAAEAAAAEEEEPKAISGRGLCLGGGGAETSAESRGRRQRAEANKSPTKGPGGARLPSEEEDGAAPSVGLEEEPPWPLPSEDESATTPERSEELGKNCRRRACISSATPGKRL